MPRYVVVDNSVRVSWLFSPPQSGSMQPSPHTVMRGPTDGGRIHRIADKPLPDQMDGIAAQRRRVCPPFPKDGLGVADGGTLDGHLDVVPRRARAVHGDHRLGLRVPAMPVVVPTAVTHVDPTDERDVTLRVLQMPQHHQLLVVRAHRPHPHIEQALTARRLDLLPHVPVLSRAEPQPVQMGAPDQATHVDSPAGRRREHRADFGARTPQPLVRISTPVREH